MATQWQRWTAVVLLGAGVVFGACGGGSDKDKATAGTQKPAGEAPPGPTINLVGKEFSFDPAKLTLKAGEASTIVLKNTGSIEHDFTVEDPGFKLTVPGNNTREKVLKIDKPGNYQFYCSVAGHKDAGMKGELTVS